MLLTAEVSMVIVGLQHTVSAKWNGVCISSEVAYALCLRPPDPGSGETPLESAMIQDLVCYWFRKVQDRSSTQKPKARTPGRDSMRIKAADSSALKGLCRES